jgi:NADPH:quinone reductase
VDARRPEGGSHAEYVRVPASSLSPLSAQADCAEAAAIPMNGLTAKTAVGTLGLQPGETMLVAGGAGVVGSFVIRLAKAAGLIVVADAKEEEMELLRRKGADVVVPRGGAMEADVRRAYPDGVDGLIDTALLGARAAALVRNAGVALSLRRSHPITDPRLQARYLNVPSKAADTASLVRLAKLYRNGALTPHVAARIPFTAATRVHGLVEQGGLRSRVALLFINGFSET